MARILVVDDEACVREVVRDLLEAQGHDVVMEESGESALVALRTKPFDVLVTDISMPGMNGLDLLRAVAGEWPGLPRLAVSARASQEERNDCLAAGAQAFLAKPFSYHELRSAVDERLAHRGRVQGPGGMVVESPAMQGVMDQVRRVADSRTTVMVVGESGVGKELVAKALHELSSRRDKPFVAIHCGALSQTLLESELFGHVRGAFTDAVRDRTGCFERAEGGTLFLDEVSTMSLDTQVRLLRVLQEREVTRVGDSSPRPVNVRVIAATNERLEELVASGRFRQDLYYRLHVFRIDVPALRERPEDIQPLVQHFLTELESGGMALSPAALTTLRAHRWPGNVRELRNVVERAIVLARGAAQLLPDHVTVSNAPIFAEADASYMKLPAGGLSLPELVEKIERHLIEQSLSRVNGSRAEAARLLGLKRTTLVQKIKRNSLGAAATA